MLYNLLLTKKKKKHVNNPNFLEIYVFLFQHKINLTHACTF